MSKLNVLLTGAAGRIGRTFTPPFSERYNLRTLDVVPNADNPEMLVGNLQDYALLESAMAGMDVVVHLAATSDEAPFLEQLVPNNIIGLYNVYEAAYKAGVKRIVFASTCQTVTAWSPDRLSFPESPIDVDAPPRPVTIYGATKVFGETLGRYYHDNRKMEFVGIRIGYFLPYDLDKLRTHKYERNLWLSPRDAVRLFTLAIEKPDVGYALVFGTSITEQEVLHREPALRLLGYQPEDDVRDLK